MYVRPGLYLTFTDVDTGEVYARFPVAEGDCFAIGFLHSVNKTPVLDVYYVEHGTLYVEQTIYYSFGAGVQTELNPGETLSYGVDGSMIISNIHKNFEQTGLTYLIGAASDHTFFLGAVMEEYVGLRGLVGVYPETARRESNGIQVISLSGLCGRYSVVSVTCEYRCFRT